MYMQCMNVLIWELDSSTSCRLSVLTEGQSNKLLCLCVWQCAPTKWVYTVEYMQCGAHTITIRVEQCKHYFYPFLLHLYSPRLLKFAQDIINKYIFLWFVFLLLTLVASALKLMLVHFFFYLSFAKRSYDLIFISLL